MELIVSNKMKSANFNATDGAYAFFGNYAADNDNVLTQINGQVRKDDVYIGSFDARREGDQFEPVVRMSFSEMIIVAPKLSVLLSQIEAQLPDAVVED